MADSINKLDVYKRQIFDTETFTVEAKSLEYDRTNFEQDLLKENYPDRNLIVASFARRSSSFTSPTRV